MSIVNKINKLQIRQKIIVAMVMVAAIPLIIVGMYATWANSSAIEAHSLKSMEFETHQIAVAMEILTRDFHDDAQFLAKVPPIKGIVRAREGKGYDEQGKSSYEQWVKRLGTIFTSFATVKHHYAYIRYVDELGNEMVRVDYDKHKATIVAKESLVNQSDSNFFTNAKNAEAGKVNVSPMVLDRIDGVIRQPHIPLVHYSVPIFNDQGKSQGMVVLSAFGDELMNILKDDSDRVAGDFYMADSNGNYLYHSDQSKVMGHELNRKDNIFLDFPSIVRPENSVSESGHLANVQGKTLAYAYLHHDPDHPDHRWTLAYSWSRNDMLRDVLEFQIIFGLLFIISLIVAIFSGVYLARQWIISPLNRLVKVIKRFSDGEMDARVKVTNDDEIGRLGNSFNDMARQYEENTQREQQQMEELQEAANINEQVEKISACLAKLAKGDLTHKVDVSGNKAMKQLGNNLNETIDSLSLMTKGMVEASGTMATTLSEIQQTVISQSSAASQQAASVNETTSTLEEIRAISGQTQEKAESLGSSAQRTQAEGEKGMDAVEQTAAGMESIREKVEGIAENILALSEQTQQIGEITGTVNNLSHQLKMLALNASIEAAKAGESGKGFAVVAAEVKDLAEQSQQATEQVHKILQEIQRATDKAVMVTEEGGKGVDQGMRLVEESGAAVRKLTEVIRETAMASQQIVVSVRQEGQGIDQIFTAMQEINKATNQFVTATEQTREAATGLSAVADELHNSASAYKV